MLASERQRRMYAAGVFERYINEIEIVVSECSLGSGFWILVSLTGNHTRP